MSNASISQDDKAEPYDSLFVSSLKLLSTGEDGISSYTIAIMSILEMKIFQKLGFSGGEMEMLGEKNQKYMQ